MMSKTQKREYNVVFSKDQREIADHLIARCFDENDGRLFFRDCPITQQFDAAVARVLEETWRPIGIKADHWRLLVRLRLEALVQQRVLTFGARSNVVFFSGHRMTELLEVAENRQLSHGKPKAYRHGRRNFNNRPPRPAFAF